MSAADSETSPLLGGDNESVNVMNVMADKSRDEEGLSHHIISLQ